ncbi:MAG UNVERIFIED_CONTAM: DUF1501 domain-containing protein [Planctomycetaceae bacterium]|jgi:hypothetical protein
MSFYTANSNESLMNTMPVSRRQSLSQAACGFGALAFNGLLHAAESAGVGSGHGPAAHFPAKAKRIIFLFMQGGPSQLDLFDPKEFIQQRHGHPIDSPLSKNILQVGTEKFLALGTAVPVRPRGNCGMPISDLLPGLASVADEICLLRGMSADNPQHMPAELQLHTGALNDVRPSMGSWISYGLGTENRNLPGFITINPHADVRYHGSAWLPAQHQGTRLTATAGADVPPIENLRNLSRDTSAQRRRIDFIQRQNQRLSQQHSGEPSLQGMIDAMELAFRMQATTPELVNLAGETQTTLDLYGVGGKDTDRNALRLSARQTTQRSRRQVCAGHDGRLGSSRRHSRKSSPPLCSDRSPRCSPDPRPAAARASGRYAGCLVRRIWTHTVEPGFEWYRTDRFTWPRTSARKFLRLDGWWRSPAGDGLR